MFKRVINPKCLPMTQYIGGIMADHSVKLVAN